MRAIRTAWVALALAAASGAGCGPGDARQGVAGTVTVGGRPLESGTITFHATVPPPGPVCGAVVVAGRYAVRADQGLEPGTYRVTISAPIPGGVLNAAEKAAGASPKAKESLPAKYNGESQLRATVVAGGQNTFDFPLD